MQDRDEEYHRELNPLRIRTGIYDPDGQLSESAAEELRTREAQEEFLSKDPVPHKKYIPPRHIRQFIASLSD